MGRNWTRHFVAIPAITFIVIAAGLVAVWYRLHAVEDDMLDERTRTTTEQVAFRFENFVGARLHVVGQLRNQWLQTQINTPERFAQVALSIKSEFPSFQAINWADPDGVIRWVVPEKDNLPAKDRDLRAHAGMAEILHDATVRAEPRASGPLTLFQGGRGFGTYFPIIRDGHCEGFINGVFRMDRLVTDCLHRGVLGAFYLRLTDGGDVLFVDGPADCFEHSPYARSQPFQVLDRQWRVTLVPTASVIDTYRTPADEIFLTLGLLVAAALAVTLRGYLQRQHAVRESEQRLRMAMENMPVMVAAFDRRGRIIVWNRRCEQVTGYSAAEVLNRSAAGGVLDPRRSGVRDSFGGKAGGQEELPPSGPTGACGTIHPDPVPPNLSRTRRSGTEADIAQPFGLATGLGQEWGITCKDGSTRTISWSNASAGVSVSGWAAWGVGTDITERRKAEHTLLLTQFAMDNAAVATFWIQEDARLSYVNQAACETLGYSREELLQMRVFDFDPNFHPDMWPDHWEQINRHVGRPRTFESLHRRRDGSTFPVEITSSSLCFQGRFYHFAFAKDITERKRAEAERLAMERALLETQKLESLGLLAGGVAHDFNNLLTAMMGSVSLARQSVRPESQLDEYLRHVESAAQQAADLARQLLAYSGRGKFELSSVDLRSAIEETGQLLRVSIPKSVVLAYELGDVPVCTMADAAQMRQIAMNLVINAAEAIGESGGTITVRTALVEADRSLLNETSGGGELSEGVYALLEVTDTGCGMSPELRAKVFEPFFSTKSTGRGLGLAAVMGIVGGHHGGIRIDTTAGRGTTVQVLLPSCEPSAPAESSDVSPRVTSADGTILVVDDEQSVRTVAKIILEESGYSVLTAGDGEQGVQVFRENADRIRAVLLDLTMPRMDGRQVMKIIRELKPGVRVLLSSGYDEQETSADDAGSAQTQFIRKPYRADQLLQRIQDILAT